MKQSLHDDNALQIAASEVAQHTTVLDTSAEKKLNEPFLQLTSSEVTKIVFSALAVALLLKIFVLEMMYVASSSMEPTLFVGDCIVVNKLSYGFRMPRTIPFTTIELPWAYPSAVETPVTKGDVIVLDSPTQDEMFFKERLVKRITAIPGEQVDIPITEETTFQATVKPTVGNITLPAAGSTIELSEQNLALWKAAILRDGNISCQIDKRIVYINGEPTASYTFRNNFYFVSGDNSAVSFDSRYWGIIPESYIIGKAVGIYVSFAPDNIWDIRTERIGSIR